MIHEGTHDKEGNYRDRSRKKDGFIRDQLGKTGLPFEALVVAWYPRSQTIDAIVFKDVASGLVKSFFFGLIIAMIGSYEGFKVQGGAEGVGKSTTQAVVVSIFLIIAADVIFTVFFFSNL